MKYNHQFYDLYFTTATILEWKCLLHENEMKELIIDSFRFLVTEKRTAIYAFVIMPNHFHVVWYIYPNYTLSNIQSALLSYTGHKFKKKLLQEDSSKLIPYYVDLADRKYQFWERNPLSIEIIYQHVLEQKINYIHCNPCTKKWQLSDLPENYKYSSAYLMDGRPFWDFITL